MDIYPTVLDNLGIKKDERDEALPGKSLIPFGRGREEDRVVFSEYYSQGIYTAMFLLRKGKYKYIHYVGERPQLFDLESDPEECIDLAESPKYQELLNQLYQELKIVADVEQLERDSKDAQRRLLEKHGGRDEFLKSFKPALFSPIPDLSK